MKKTIALSESQIELLRNVDKYGMAKTSHGWFEFTRSRRPVVTNTAKSLIARGLVVMDGNGVCSLSNEAKHSL